MDWVFSVSHFDGDVSLVFLVGAVTIVIIVILTIATVLDCCTGIELVQDHLIL